MAASAGVSTSDVVIVSITAGSVQVASQVTLGSSATVSASTFAALLESSPASVFIDASFSAYGTPVTYNLTSSTSSATSSPSASPPPPPPLPSTSTPTSSPTMQSASSDVQLQKNMTIAGSSSATMSDDDTATVVTAVANETAVSESSVAILSSTSTSETSSRRQVLQSGSATYAHSMTFGLNCASAEADSLSTTLDAAFSSGAIANRLMEHLAGSHGAFTVQHTPSMIHTPTHTGGESSVPNTLTPTGASTLPPQSLPGEADWIDEFNPTTLQPEMDASPNQTLVSNLTYATQLPTALPPATTLSPALSLAPNTTTQLPTALPPEYEEVVVEYEEPEPDFAPPVITLTGDAMVEVEQFSTYTDSGAVANDLVDGAVRCWRVDDLGTELDTSEVTPAGAPHVLVYRAEDASGNGAEEQRQVAVVSPCVDPSYLCDRDSTEDPILCATCSASGDGQAEEWTCLCLASFETGNNVEVEEFVPVADVTPPVLTLLGDGTLAQTSGGAWLMIHYVEIHGTFNDPGVEAVDDIDGNITARVSSYGVGAVDTSVETPTESPYVITYNVADHSGNLAAEVRRRVYVLNSCPEGELPCGDASTGGEVECSENGLCSSVSMGEEEEVAVNELPAVHLTGPATIQVDQGAGYGACFEGAALSTICDRGATATDVEDGNLDSMVTACSTDGVDYKFEKKGLTGCSHIDTNIPGTYSVLFEVYDSSGGYAQAVRNVTVKAACGAGERLCSDAVTCSEDGVCLSDMTGAGAEEEEEVPPPTLWLRNSSVLSAFIEIKQYQSYAKCAAGVAPSKDELCELGAEAEHLVDGNLTATVLSCPPDSCLSTGCPGHEFVAKGLEDCLNTGADVGTIIEIKFMSKRQVAPGETSKRQVTPGETLKRQMAPGETSKRQVTPGEALKRQVAPAGAVTGEECGRGAAPSQGLEGCPRGRGDRVPGAHHEDFTCSSLECDSRDALLESDATPPDVVPPVITLLHGSPLRLSYGVPEEGLSLIPCPSQNETDGCYAVAVDDTDGDVSARISVAAVTSSTGDVCSVEMAPLAECFPSTYTYEYQAVDEAGNVATATLLVELVEEAKVNAELRITAASTNPADAASEAACLLNASTAENAAFRSGIAQLLNDQADASAGIPLTAEDIEVVNVTASPKQDGGFDLLVEFATAAAVAGGDTSSATARRHLLTAPPQPSPPSTTGPPSPVGDSSTSSPPPDSASAQPPPPYAPLWSRCRTPVQETEVSPALARADDLAAVLQSASSPGGDMGSYLAAAASEQNASLSTDVAGLTNNASSQQVTGEVDEVAALAAAIKAEMATLTAGAESSAAALDEVESLVAQNPEGAEVEPRFQQKQDSWVEGQTQQQEYNSELGDGMTLSLTNQNALDEAAAALVIVRAFTPPPPHKRHRNSNRRCH
ncbi:hypothetical protein CYMTET_10848 [Cymbomonas tetramitiformis]|uniref:Pesticidal crystal protein Cry22Aa Ig-like domain-containing protein n=1 Tax=Cymbomonas tetramitiformis TaxID=36881 RepID=A0AAE0GPU7_9CHLO|nr:hypothetical protein CYMTET_10848 [Cymbomonas tetramitiformis]